MNIKTNRVLAITAAASLALGLSACDSSDTDAANGKLSVLASFYPLQFVTEQVGGEHVSVESLTPQGAEPHDLELSPAHTRKISTADLVVYQAGFQKAVDDAIDTRKPANTYDSSSYANHVEVHDDDEEHSADDGHDHGSTDPHFWLDPTLLADVAEDIAAKLTELDPDNAQDYEANATKLVEKLDAEDAKYTETLGATCTSRTIVVTHEAFGYLTSKYDLTQIGISGIDPEAEPSPAAIRKVRAQISDAGITTIFFETLTSPKVAETLAKDLGISARVLDPIEGLVDENTDYFTIMDANLDALKAGMNCA